MRAVARNPIGMAAGTAGLLARLRRRGWVRPRRWRNSASHGHLARATGPGSAKAGPGSAKAGGLGLRGGGGWWPWWVVAGASPKRSICYESIGGGGWWFVAGASPNGDRFLMKTLACTPCVPRRVDRDRRLWTGQSPAAAGPWGRVDGQFPRVPLRP